MTGIPEDRVDAILQSETARFVQLRPGSRELHERAQKSMIGGVPMQWMVEWAGAFPVFANEARGVLVVPVSGRPASPAGGGPVIPAQNPH